MGAAVQAATTKIYHQKQKRSNKYSQKSLNKNIAYKELLLCNCRWSRFTFVLTGEKKKNQRKVISTPVFSPKHTRMRHTSSL